VKKTTSLIALILFLSIGVYAQEKKAAIGVGPEWNMNSRENFAGGAGLAFDYMLPNSFAAGITFTASSNFSGASALEPAALFRWYFLGGYTGFFLQADIGTFLFFDKGEIFPYFLGGLSGGFRLPFNSSFYMEPYGRLGYPFAFGIGVLFGIRFIDNGGVILDKEIIFKR